MESVRESSGVASAVDLLASAPLFARIPRPALADLAAATRRVQLEARDWLFREGDPADAVYVVASGRLRVVAMRDGVARVLRVVGPPAALGELALLTGEPRSASVQAIRDSELLAIGRESFEELLAEQDTALAVARTLAHQLQESGGLGLQDASPVVIAVVGTAGDRSGRVCAALAEALREWKPAAILTRPDGSNHARLLNDLERTHGFVLLVADSSLADEWERFCVGQADRVLLLVHAGDAAAQYDGDLRGSDVVFVGAPRSGTATGLLRTLGARTHYVVEESHFEAGIRRLARRLTGRSVGLVLSGGGARGYAHIGVYEVLCRAGVEIDRVGGCSMGALFAAMIAHGWSADHIREICQEECVRRSPFSDYTVPRVALIRARRAAAMLQRVFGDSRAEELERPLYTVSADLVSSDLVVHRDGPVWEAVGVSMSIPGLTPPVQRDGRLLVDGGVLNNLPIDVMAESDEGPVIGVDVMHRLDLPVADDRIALPSIFETLSRATVLGSAERAETNRRLAHLVIAPDAREIALRDFSQLDRGIEVGRDAAQAALTARGLEGLLASRG